MASLFLSLVPKTIALKNLCLFVYLRILLLQLVQLVQLVQLAQLAQLVQLDHGRPRSKAPILDAGEQKPAGNVI